ncbi:hypothetical protein OAN96_01085 [Candidatus Gracilibacteria bacterium]|nr:hypothetical protein [Candidatus Gracilibacteria bacterium]
MNLFVNAVSTQGALFLFDEGRNIIVQEYLEIKGNESSKLPETIDNFLISHDIDYSQLDNIVVVHGPGSFTGVRAICLMVSTMAFSTDITLTSMSYFELFSQYPITKQSSKRDMFMQKSAEADVEIISNEDVVMYLEDNEVGQVYGELPTGYKGKLVENIDYCDIIRQVKLDSLKRVDPLYIKKPNIC